MFCPKCRVEYIEGISLCDDCGSPLVGVLSEKDANGNPEELRMTDVFTTNNSIEANFIKSLLESNNIGCFIKNEYLVSINILMSQAVQIKVAVEQENETRAKAIIAQYYEDLRKTGL